MATRSGQHTVGLTLSVVGILTDYDNLDTAERGEVGPCVYVLSCYGPVSVKQRIENGWSYVMGIF